MSQYRSKIKTCLQTITKSLKQIPEDKQPIIASRVNKILQKYSANQNTQTEQNLLKFNKELEFNLNFIKLSYPNINFSLEQNPQPKPQQQSHQKSKQPERPFPTEPGKLAEQFEIDNAEALKKQMKDISGVREEVDFTNWSEGNVDPQNIKKHKQLLTRQHFGGDFWNAKQIPKMQSVKTVASMMQNLEPPTITDKDLQKKDKVFAYDPQAAFEKVKR